MRIEEHQMIIPKTDYDSLVEQVRVLEEENKTLQEVINEGVDGVIKIKPRYDECHPRGRGLFDKYYREPMVLVRGTEEFEEYFTDYTTKIRQIAERDHVMRQCYNILHDSVKLNKTMWTDLWWNKRGKHKQAVELTVNARDSVVIPARIV